MLAKKFHSKEETRLIGFRNLSYLVERYLSIGTSDSVSLAGLCISFFSREPAFLVALELEKILSRLIRKEPHNMNETEASKTQMHDELIWKTIFFPFLVMLCSVF